MSTNECVDCWREFYPDQRAVQVFETARSGDLNPVGFVHLHHLMNREEEDVE